MMQRIKNGNLTHLCLFQKYLEIVSPYHGDHFYWQDKQTKYRWFLNIDFFIKQNL